MDSITKEKLIAKLSADSQSIDQNRKRSRADSQSSNHTTTDEAEVVPKPMIKIEPPRTGRKLNNDTSVLTPVFLPTNCKTDIDMSNIIENNNYTHTEYSNENSMETLIYCEDSALFDQNNINSGNLKFDTNFECGSLYSVVLLQNKDSTNMKEEYNLTLRQDPIDVKHEQQNNCSVWYFFRVHNQYSGSHRFHLGPFHENFMSQMKNNSMRPVIFRESAYKKSEESWQYISENLQYNKTTSSSGSSTGSGSSSYTLSLTVTFPTAGDTTYIAFAPPYTYTQLQTTLLQLSTEQKNQSILSLRPLCRTIAGNRCDIVTITEQTTATTTIHEYPKRNSSISSGSSKQRTTIIDMNIDSTVTAEKDCSSKYSEQNVPKFLQRLQDQLDREKYTAHITQPVALKKVIIVTARTRGCDVGSSWICEGLIRFLLSNHTTAVALRKMFVFYIVPMLNPDSVVSGLSYSNTAGVDISTQWKHPSVALHPTVYYLKQLLQRLHEQIDTQVVGVFDLCDQQTHSGVCMYSSIPTTINSHSDSEHSTGSTVPADPRNFFLAAGRRSALINLKACSLLTTTTTNTDSIHSARVVVSEEFSVPLSIAVCAAMYCGGSSSTHSAVKQLQSLDYARVGCILCAALADIHGIGARVRPPLQPKPQMSRVRRASMRAASLTVHNGLDAAALDTTATATSSNNATISASIVIGSSAVCMDMKHKLVVCSSDGNSEGHSEVSTLLLLALHTTHSSSDGSGSKDRIDLDALLSEVDFDLNFDEDYWTAKNSSSSVGGSSSVAVVKAAHCNTANTGTTVLIPTVRMIHHTANVCSSAEPTQILHSNSTDTGNTSTKHMYSSTTTANTTTTTTTPTNNISNTKKADLPEKTSTIKYNEHKELVRVNFTRNTELTGVHSGLPGKQLGGIRGAVSFTVPVSRTVSCSSGSSSTTAPVAPQKSTTQDNIQYELMQCTPPLTTLTDTLSEKDEWAQEVGDTYTRMPMTVHNHQTEQSPHSKAQLFAMGASSMLTVEDSAADVCSSSSAEAAVEYVPTATDVVNCKGEDSLLTTVSSTAATTDTATSHTTTAPTTNTATSAHIHNQSTETKEEYIEQCDSSEPAEFTIPLSMSVTGIDPLHNPLSPVFTLYRGITPLYSERVAGLLKSEQSEEDSTLRLHSRLGTASAVQSRALTPALNTHSSSAECAQALTLSNCSSDRQERTTAINLPYVRYSTLEAELSQFSVEGGVYEPSTAAVAAAEHGGSSQHFPLSTEASLHSQHSLAHGNEYHTTLSARERTSPSLELPLKGTSSRMRPVFDDSVYGESMSSTIQDLQTQFLQEMGLDYNQLYGTGGILSPTVAHSAGKHHHYKNRSPKPTAVLRSTQQLGVNSKAFPLRKVLYEKDVVVFPSISSEGSGGLPELVSEGPRGMGSIRPVESDKVYVQHKLEQFYVHAEDTLRQQQSMSEADAAITARRVFDQAYILAATADQHDLRRQRQQNTICRKWLSSQRSGTKSTKKHMRLPTHADITVGNSIVDDGSSRLNTAMYRAVRADLKSHGSAESSILRNYNELIVSGGSRDRMDAVDKKVLEQCSEGNSWQWLTGSEQGMLDDTSILGSGGGGLSCVGSAVSMPLTTATVTAPTALKGSTESPRKRIVPTIQVQLPLPTAEVHSEDRAITPALQKLIQQAAAATVVDTCGGGGSPTPASNSRSRGIQSPRSAARQLCSPVRTSMQLFAERQQASTVTTTADRATTTYNTTAHNSSSDEQKQRLQQLAVKLYTMSLPPSDRRTGSTAVTTTLPHTPYTCSTDIGTATTSMAVNYTSSISSTIDGGSVLQCDGHDIDRSLQLAHREVPADPELQRADSEYDSYAHYGQLYSQSLMLEQQADCTTGVSGSALSGGVQHKSVLRFNPLISKRLCTQAGSNAHPPAALLLREHCEEGNQTTTTTLHSAEPSMQTTVLTSAAVAAVGGMTESVQHVSLVSPTTITSTVTTTPTTTSALVPHPPPSPASSSPTAHSVGASVTTTTTTDPTVTAPTATTAPTSSPTVKRRVLIEK